ncbi:MAG: hypothetical protein H6707_03090 [Deltaproteobacteria bacterium]|nr:hypothetical protein [Deltaproteobacteria bacterium]
MHHAYRFATTLLFLANAWGCSESSAPASDAAILADSARADASRDTRVLDGPALDKAKSDASNHDAASDDQTWPADASADTNNDLGIDASADQGAQDAGSSDAGSSPGGKHLWSLRFGDSESERVLGVGSDALGNVYITGVFRGSIDFGGGTLTAGGHDDMFVASFSKGGKYRWAKVFGDKGAERGEAIAVDSSGNSFITGSFQTKINFGGSDLLDAGLSDIFVVSFDKDGKHRWSRRFGSANNEHPYNVALDRVGNVYFSGLFQLQADFGQGPLTSAGSFDAYLASYANDGKPRWAKRFGGKGSDYAHGIGTDAQGNVYLQGSFEDTIDLGGTVHSSAGNYDVFLVSFDKDGKQRWSARHGGTETEQARGAAVDDAGNFYVCGRIWGDSNFGGSALKHAGSADIYLAAYDKDGKHRWSKRFGDADEDSANALVIDPLGRIYLAGYFHKSLNLGGATFNALGWEDGYVASFDAQGGHRFSLPISSSVTDKAHALALSKAAQLLVGGEFQQTIDLGGGPLKSAGFADALLFALTP